MARRKEPMPPDDDGRTIAPMNVEGMPWYTPPGGTGETNDTASAPEPIEKKDRRHYILGAVMAALAAAAVFGTAYLLFILFCVHVWLK